MRFDAKSNGLHPVEKLALIALGVTVVVFGVVVEIRSAFQPVRKTDLPNFLRAARAVRSGEDIYEVECGPGLHYNYPPPLAILLVPLAEAPPGQDPAGTLPYPAAVAVWYLLSVAFLALGVHLLASALEDASPGAPGGSAVGGRRWWHLRVVPVLVCLPAVGSALSKGQVGLLLLFLLCGMTAALLRWRSLPAGLWLAGAVCLKIVPAYLLLHPLSRRDGRFLAGWALGMAAGLIALPAAVFGATRTVECYRTLARAVLLPGLGLGEDTSRAEELTGASHTDSQSFQSVLHNLAYPDADERPDTIGPPLRAAHWFLAALLTVLTFCAAGRGRGESGTGLVLFIGSLMVVMNLTTPICHMHYFCLSLPLAMGLQAAAWERRGTMTLGPATGLLLAVHVAASLLPKFAGLDLLRDCGLTGLAALMLWAAGVAVLWRRPPARSPDPAAWA